MRLTLLLLFIASCAFGCTVTVTSPAAAANINGYAYSLTATNAGCTTPVYSLEFLLDGEHATQKFAMSPYETVTTVTYNTYSVDNGNHAIQVIGRDLLGNTLATSATVNFSIWNWLPQQTCAYSDAPTSACTGLTETDNATGYFQIGGAQTMGAASLTLKCSANPCGVNPIVQQQVVNSGSLTLSGIGATHGIFVWLYYTSGNTPACSDAQGSYTAAASNPNTTAKWFWLLNSNAGTHAISCTSTGTVNAMYALEVQGIPTSGVVDVDTSATVSGASVYTSIAGQAQANEYALHGGEWNGVRAATNHGYLIFLQDANQVSAVEVSIPNGTNPTGVWAYNYTVTGANAGGQKDVSLSIDGLLLADGVANVALIGPVPSATSATGTILVDTTKYLSGIPHTLILEARNTNGTTGIFSGNPGLWSSYGGWESQQTFSNPVSPMELLASARDQVIVCASFPCGNTATLTAQVWNSDNTKTSATITSCVSGTPHGETVTAFTVTSPGCVITPIAYGSGFVTTTYSNGLTRRAWISVRTANVFPHFGNDGSRLTTYTPGKSILFHSLFLTSWARATSPVFAYLNQDGTLSGFSGASNTLWANQFKTAYAAMGYQAVENTTIGVGRTDTFASFKTRADNWVTNTCAPLSSAGLKLWGDVSAGFFSDGHTLDAAYYSFYSPGASFSTLPLTYLTNSLTGNCGLMLQGQDENPAVFGLIPYADISANTGVALGSHGYTNIQLAGSTTATAHGAGQYSFTGNQTFIVTGTGAAALDSSVGNCLAGFVAPFQSATFPFTFTAAASATATLTSGLIEPFARNVYDASGNNIASGNCAGWVHANLFNLAHAQIGAGTNHIGIGYPILSNTVVGAPTQAPNWCQTNVAEFCINNPSGTANGAQGLPLYSSLSPLNQDNGAGDFLRQMYGYTPDIPIIDLVGVLSANYTFHGYPCPIASMSGNTITFSQECGQRNVFPGISRLSVCAAPPCTGTSGTVSYYVESWPTATTAIVTLANDTGTSPTGTATFDDGGTCTGANFSQALMGGGTSNLPGTMGTGSVCSGTATNPANERGHTFTVAGDARTFRLEMETLDTANLINAYSLVVRQVPVLSCVSSCGVAYIIPDNLIRRGGGSYAADQETGPRVPFVQSMYYMIAGKSAGGQQYGPDAATTQNYDRTGVGVTSGFGTHAVQSRVIFQSISIQTNQPGADPVFNDFRSFQSQQSAAMSNLMQNRLAPYVLQPQLASPDCGRFFECAAKQDGSGNRILMVQSLSDWPLSFTSTLTPYLIGGQGIVRECADWRDVAPVVTIAAATATDTYTYPPGGFCAYIFDNSSSAVIDQRSLGVNLGDVTGATGWAIEWTQGPAFGNGIPYAFQDQTDSVPNVVDCGSATRCAIPADRNVGPITYRPIYYDANKKPLTLRGALSTL